MILKRCQKQTKSSVFLTLRTLPPMHMRRGFWRDSLAWNFNVILRFLPGSFITRTKNSRRTFHAVIFWLASLQISSRKHPRSKWQRNSVCLRTLTGSDGILTAVLRYSDHFGNVFLKCVSKIWWWLSGKLSSSHTQSVGRKSDESRKFKSKWWKRKSVKLKEAKKHKLWSKRVLISITKWDHG